MNFKVGLPGRPSGFASAGRWAFVPLALLIMTYQVLAQPAGKDWPGKEAETASRADAVAPEVWLALNETLSSRNSKVAVSDQQQGGAGSDTVISVKDFGAKGDDRSDDLEAFDRATAALQPWQKLYIPPGSYRLSGRWIIKNKYRVKIECDGVIKPLPPYDDYLVEFDNDSGDPLAKAIGQQVVVRGLTVDAEWRSRGVKISRVWDSSFENLHVWRPYGHGLYTPMLQEVSFYKPVIFMGKPRMTRTRDNSKEIAAVAQEWKAGRRYEPGDYVKTAAPPYSGSKTYHANETVRDGGELYRALTDGVAGLRPALSPESWERVAPGYYQATGLKNNINRSPEHTRIDYTTRAQKDSDKYWRPVYPDEAAWEMVGVGANATIDNVKVWNFISRSNANETILRIDDTENSFPVSQVELHAAQIHAITKQYITAFNADANKIEQYGGKIMPPQHSVLVHAASTTGFKIIGGQLRTANLDRAKGLLAGNLGKSGNAARTFLVAASINGEGEQCIGLSVMPSVRTFKSSHWNEAAFEILMNGRGSMERADPTKATVPH